MNKLELSGFLDLVNRIENSEGGITISEYFDRCVNYIRENNLNIDEKYFLQLKFQIEEEIKKWAIEHYVSSKLVLENNVIERTKKGLTVWYVKYKNKIFDFYFPCEFNKNFVLARSIY